MLSSSKCLQTLCNKIQNLFYFFHNFQVVDENVLGYLAHNSFGTRFSIHFEITFKLKLDSNSDFPNQVGDEKPLKTQSHENWFSRESDCSRKKYLCGVVTLLPYRFFPLNTSFEIDKSGFSVIRFSILCLDHRYFLYLTSFQYLLLLKFRVVLV